jgi:hypothetical protein
MYKFNEELLQFIWKHKLLKPIPFISRSGTEISVIKYGELNPDSGPDFFNAQIKVNGLVLAGNIEIHIKTSDWLKHNHQNDKNYDNIILHAVYEHDVDLPQNLNHQVEVLELKNLIATTTLETYATLSGNKDKLPCSAHLKKANDLKFISWIERMTIERLEEKVKRIEHIFQAYYGDYTQTFYTCLLRNFGFKVNAIPFELLANQLPLSLLLKHADNLVQLEALLLGMSGLLEDQLEDKYLQNLQNEFNFLSKKYGLIPLKKEVFKFSKLRPANFPTLRLAQFACLIHTQSALFTSPQTFSDYVQLIQTLKIKLEGYWRNHYSLDGNLVEKDLTLGDMSAENVIINTFAPFFFFYSKRLAKPGFMEYSLALLNACKKEDNAKTKLFSAKKELLLNAAGTQALINLYDNYCRNKACLKCGIAASILNPV